MTFTEAAIEVLRREGKPLHFTKIAEIAVRENLLDHVGKIADDTMADQLVAHCRLPHADRRLIPVQLGTFALVEWGLDEDATGLENLIEQPPELDLLYRGRERHPVPSREMSRGAGRGAEGRPGRRREEEGRQRRFPPPSEVAYEILAGAGRALSLAEIAAQGAERLLMPDAFVRDVGSLQAALLEDNRRREGNGRRALFQLDGDQVTLVAQPEPGERAAAPVVARAPVGAGEARRAGLAALRRRLRECDGPTVEHLAGQLLERLGFTELKVAKRGREHVVYTGRRKMGLGEVRHGIRIVRGGADAARRDVSDLRRDLAHYGAQIGVVLTAGEAAREARGEASAAGQLPVILLCGEALAEAFADAGVGCVPVVVPEIDEAFFKAATEAAEKEEAARRARREERDRREGREPREGREGREGREPREGREGREGRREKREPREPRPSAEAPAEGGPVIHEVLAEIPEALPGSEEAVVVVAATLQADAGDADDGDDLEGDDEGAEGDEAESAGGAAPAGAPGEAGAGGERRRRRRRRRRRGGRGRGKEGAAGERPAEGAPQASAEGAPGPAEGAPAAAPEPPPPPPPEPASGGEQG
ncbi:MAG: HTH domain-containing protein [Anaeromyxobacter sp.]